MLNPCSNESFALKIMDLENPWTSVYEIEIEVWLRFSLHACFDYDNSISWFGFSYEFFMIKFDCVGLIYWNLIYGFCYGFCVLRLLVVVMKMMNRLLVVVVRSDFFFWIMLIYVLNIYFLLMINMFLCDYD
jgi:hypothetical protein